MDLNSYQTAHPSPDGRHAIVTTAEEVRMSHWIEWAQLVVVPEHRAVLDIGSRSWSADRISWSSDGTEAVLHLRRYPGDHDAFQVRLFPARACAELDSNEGTERLAFTELSAAMEACYERQRRRLGVRDETT